MAIYKRYYILFLLTTLSISAFCQKIDKIDRTKQRPNATKTTNSSKKTSSISNNQKKKNTSRTAPNAKQKQTTYKNSKEQTPPPSKENTPPLNNDSREIIEFSVSKTNLAFGPEGGKESIYVTSDQAWSISYNPAGWGLLTRNGNILTLRVDPNSTSTARTDFFKLKSGEKVICVNISQSAKPYDAPYLNTSKSSLAFNSSGGSETIIISTNKEWKITKGNISWGHIKINGNSLSVSVDANWSNNKRIDYLTIQAGELEKHVSISQEGRSIVTSPTYNSYSDYYYSKQKDFAKNWWWKGRVRIGWNVTAFDIDADFEDMSWRSGLRLRFGKSTDWFNLILGCDYSMQRKYVKGGSRYVTTGTRWIPYNYNSGYYEDTGYWEVTSSEWKLVHHEIIIPIELRLNFAKCGSEGRWYLGAGFDFGIKIANGDLPSKSKSYILDPQLGIMWKHFDLGIDYRLYQEDSRFNYKNARFGLYGTWFF